MLASVGQLSTASAAPAVATQRKHGRARSPSTTHGHSVYESYRQPKVTSTAPVTTSRRPTNACVAMWLPW